MQLLLLLLLNLVPWWHRAHKSLVMNIVTISGTRLIYWRAWQMTCMVGCEGRCQFAEDRLNWKMTLVGWFFRSSQDVTDPVNIVLGDGVEYIWVAGLPVELCIEHKIRQVYPLNGPASMEFKVMSGLYSSAKKSFLCFSF